MIQIENVRSRKGGVKSLVHSEDFGLNQIDESVIIKYDVEKAMAQYNVRSTPLTNLVGADGNTDSTLYTGEPGFA